jgi:hypothetical protein
MSEYTQFVQKKYLDRPRAVPGLDEDEAERHVEELVLWIQTSSAAREKEHRKIEKELDKNVPEGGHLQQNVATKFRVLAQSALTEYRSAIERGFRVSLDDVAWVLAALYLEGHRRGK